MEEQRAEEYENLLYNYGRRVKKTIAKMVQTESFLQEIRDLKKDREVHRKSKL